MEFEGNTSDDGLNPYSSNDFNNPKPFFEFPDFDFEKETQRKCKVVDI